MRPHRWVPHSNLIANALNSGRESDCARVPQEAQSSGAPAVGPHAILVSAENFYAMSVLASMAEEGVCVNAVERDQRLIETLGSLIPEGIDSVQDRLLFPSSGPVCGIAV